MRTTKLHSCRHKSCSLDPHRQLLHSSSVKKATSPVPFTRPPPAPGCRSVHAGGRSLGAAHKATQLTSATQQGTQNGPKNPLSSPRVFASTLTRTPAQALLVLYCWCKPVALLRSTKGPWPRACEVVVCGSSRSPSAPSPASEPAPATVANAAGSASSPLVTSPPQCIYPTLPCQYPSTQLWCTPS